MFSHNCSLECLNGGTCSSSSSDTSTTNAYPMEVCDCPPGFSGVNCNDTSFVLCGPNQRRCLNGATCVHSIDPITKIDQSFCDCSVASIRDRAFAGQFCQHLVTIYCPVETDDDPSSFPRHSFCSNGGRCKRIVQDGEMYVS
jgi:EGF-like domain